MIVFFSFILVQASALTHTGAFAVILLISLLLQMGRAELKLKMLLVKTQKVSQEGVCLHVPTQSWERSVATSGKGRWKHQRGCRDDTEGLLMACSPTQVFSLPLAN